MAAKMTTEAKIAQLLAQAESTTHEAEAITFREHAERLMVRFGIEEATARAHGQKPQEEIVQRTVSFTGIYKTALVYLVHYISEPLGCKILISRSWDKKTESAYVIGFDSDVARVEQLARSLEHQVLSAVKQWWKSAPERSYLTGMEAFKSRRSFILGFGQECKKRLAEANTEVVEEQGAGTELVLVNRKKLVDEFAAGMATRKSRGGMSGGLGGATAGRQAARNANLGQTGLGGGRGSIAG